MKTSTIRRLILGAALGCAGVLAFSAPANADDGTQQPGGVLGAVVESVDKVLPNPTKAAEPDPEPEPTRDPEPPAKPHQDEEPAPRPERDEPADEPSRGPDEQDEQQADNDEPEDEAPTDTAPPATNPIEQVKDGLEQVVEPVKEIIEVVTAPLPSPPVVIPTPAPVVPLPLPVVTPAPTQPTAPTTVPGDTTEADVDEQTEAPAIETPEVEPAVTLPVVGPTAGTATLLPGLTPDDAPAEDTATVETCGSPEPRTLAEVRKAVRKAADRQQLDQTRADQHGPEQPCPGQPAGPTELLAAVTAVPCPGTQGSDHMLAVTSAVGLPCPALQRLYELRPRADIPAGRPTHLDPRPA